MSFSLELSSLSKKERGFINRNYFAKERKTLYNGNPKPNYCFKFDKDEDVIYLPLSKWKTYFNEFPTDDYDYPTTNVKFNKHKLYTTKTDPRNGTKRDQDVVAREAIALLKKDNAVFISAFTGYGKTSIGTYLTAWSGLKTVVLSHLSIVRDQWKDEFEKFTNAKVQMVKGKKPLDPDADVYVIGIMKAANMPREVFSDIGLVIVDEAHLVTLSTFTKTLLKFEPKYLVGMSATPDRRDGLHKLLHIYFGPKKKFICRFEVKNFTVVKYNTRYKPTIEYRYVKGRVVPNWNLVKSSLEYNPERQQEIAEIAIKHKEHKIIILSYLQKQSRAIYNILKNAKESVELYIGNKKTFDKSKRILVVGLKKGGVGLNDPDRTMLILASNSRDVRQFEGRIRTVNNLIYDIVDDYKGLENHWDLREEWFLSRGATIVKGGVERAKKGKEPRRRRLKPNTAKE